MKLSTNLALMTALGLIAANTAGASVFQYYDTGMFLMASGGTIFTNNTPPLGTSSPGNAVTFSSGSQTVTITFADLATLAVPNSVNSPSNLSYGIFDVNNGGSNTAVTVGAFTFDLTVHDLTDAGTAVFHGSSAGGTVANNSTNIVVSWSPTTSPAVGNQIFTIFTPTALVPPTTTAGETTIQGQVTPTVPEPASMLLMGAGLLGLGFVSKRKLSNKA